MKSSPRRMIHSALSDKSTTVHEIRCFRADFKRHSSPRRRRLGLGLDLGATGAGERRRVGRTRGEGRQR
jgi:hypothetical protein